MLESLAHSNYHAPRPRPIDPAVLYDLVKIRKLVDDATNLAVRAASGIASSAVMKDGGLLGGGAAGVLGLGIAGGGPAPRLSRERKHRMRELATQKLAKAYKLDEIAASVATMQSASSLEEVANLVLQRNPDDPDAKYVHFFHEKIPSRMLAKCTSLKPLDDVIAERPSEGAPLRTRAVTKGFKEDYVSAAADLTQALGICRTRHGHDTSSMVLGGRTGSNGSTRHGESRTGEEDQPSSLEAQLLFHRASTYLTIASGHIEATLTPKVTAATAAAATSSDASVQAAEAEASAKREAARKIVRTNAKRALRDFIKFLSNFDYTPGLPAETTEDFLRKVNDELNKSTSGRGMNGHDSNNVEKDAKKLLEIFYRQSNNHDGEDTRSGNSSTNGHSTNGRPGNGLPSPQVYPVSTLFTSPPASLPPYPCNVLATASSSTSSTPSSSTSSAVAAAAAAFLAESNEAITYHPLLTDALHSVLLCHILIQTPSKELLRHAYMVARLARVCDGYPIFLAARSPARADWIEMLRKTNNHVGLESTWEGLCSPAPLPSPTTPSSPAFSTSEQKLLTSSTSSSSSAAASALVLSKGDDHKKQLQHQHQHQHQQQQINTPKRWAQEDGGKEYPISTERASMVAKWVKDAAKREKARKDDPASVPEPTAPRRKKSSPKIAAAKGPGMPLALPVVAVGCAEL